MRWGLTLIERKMTLLPLVGYIVATCVGTAPSGMATIQKCQVLLHSQAALQNVHQYKMNPFAHSHNCTSTVLDSKTWVCHSCTESLYQNNYCKTELTINIEYIVLALRLCSKRQNDGYMKLYTKAGLDNESLANKFGNESLGQVMYRRQKKPQSSTRKGTNWDGPEMFEHQTCTGFSKRSIERYGIYHCKSVTLWFLHRCTLDKIYSFYL